MLEISHLSKIYKNIRGKDVLALNDISLKFPETGMVFLLGKSGSGKSTLLNVCGGLDNPSDGEIIIKGKSSKSFTQADFDSYRNTYVGFIFQEYNILNEFTVYDNIALAIELQNKTVEHEKIIKLLKDVDLEGYEKRKPNTLSGGQKQRIAIARALIKNPEIIMADEPTGALDSNTGKQVLDTLKKLSKERLVIVVSHDREFAETYGDRIIELKDGKVICDNTKVSKKSEVLSENINLVGDTLCINDASLLNDTDFIKIKEFLKSSDKVILSKNSENISSFKKVAKINDSNEQEVFEDTNENNITLKKYDQSKNIFIKSKLPLKHAIKIGISGLKNKPFRLLFTILLCSISFILFGLLSTMTFYNSENIFKDTLQKYEYDFIRLGKEYFVSETSYYSDGSNFTFDIPVPTSFYENEYNELKSKYGNDIFYGIQSYVGFPSNKTKNVYYSDFFTDFAYMDEGNKLRETIVGSYPVKDDEILLSSYIVDCMIYYGVNDGNNKSLNIKEKKDIIGMIFIFNNKKYKVVGYFDSGNIDEKYEVLKQNNDNSMLQKDYMNYLNDSLSLIAFVSKNQLKNLSFNNESNNYYFSSVVDYSSIVYKNTDDENFPTYSNGSYLSFNDLNNKNIIGNDIDDNSVYLSPRMFADVVFNEYNDKVYDNPKYEKIIDKAVNVMNSGVYKGNELVSFTRDELIKEVKDLFNLVGGNLKFDIQLFSLENNASFGDVKTYKINGVFFDYLDRHVVAFSDNVFNSLWNIQKENLEYYSDVKTDYVVEVTPYQMIYVPFNRNSDEINNMWKIYSNNEYSDNGSRQFVRSSFIDTLTYLDEIVDLLSVVFLYAGIFLCVFALLLLSNFIALSISNKTKEIGILRAVGARGIDVFKIFFSESFVIASICITISLISCIVVCDILNNILASEIGVSVFVFGIVSLVIMLVLAFVTTVIATYLPVRKAAKKKPVESIRAL